MAFGLRSNGGAKVTDREAAAAGKANSRTMVGRGRPPALSTGMWETGKEEEDAVF